MPPVVAPLEGWTVVDLSAGIAGAYCTKILVDGGADVVKVETPDGDPLRAWSASGATVSDGDDLALFKFLGESKRSVVVDPGRSEDLGYLYDILGRADAVIWTPGSRLAERDDLTPAAILGNHPHLTVTSVTPFGLVGPWADRAATEFTLQAWSGGVIGLGRGDPNRAPVFVGGQIGSWLSGVYAAVGTMASRMRNDGGYVGEIVDVSMLEVLAMCLTYYPVTYFDVTGRPFRGRRSIVTPGVGTAKDGLVAVGVGTGQHWLDFCVMVGHPEWMEDRSLFRERGHLAPLIDEWFASHSVEEITELATAFRLPHALIANGENLPQLDHFKARESFVKDPGGSFVQPEPPYRMHPAVLRAPGPAPSLGRDTGYLPAGKLFPRNGSPSVLPFSGIRVVDMTAFWAGPSCTHILALLGAEVIHVESPRRVDGTRMLGVPMTEDHWWERSPIFSGLNTNKSALALDFQSESGMEVILRLIASADVVVENFTPRVMDQVGLTFERMRAVRDDIILVRMPGFGLDGPWRDKAAFAYTIEDASGLTWMTGYPDEKPLEPYCVGDPNAGIHALAGLLLALAHRARTGEGVQVEAAMIDAAINVTAEQVIEFSAYGSLLERAGNRGTAAVLQNLYKTGEVDERGNKDCCVAIAVETEDQWEALKVALDDPPWAQGVGFSTVSAWDEHRDLIDEQLCAWCSDRKGDEIVELLWTAGVPVAKVMQPHNQGDLLQLQARGFFEVVDHPFLGSARHSTLPMRFSVGPARFHKRHAPLLGEHNLEVLTRLGLTDPEMDQLEADGVTGRAPVDHP
jgi:crotonobetainyl-CoA:carnitine CoA-transferase CaiB-like acyl-CoA transferase